MFLFFKRKVLGEQAAAQPKLPDPVSDRRRFLKGQFAALGELIGQAVDSAVISAGGGKRYLRPPGAIDESSFVLTCSRGHACVAACPKGAIKVLGAEAGAAVGTPYIDPLDKPCYLCLECTKVCTSGALEALTDMRQAKMGTVQLHTDACWAYNSMYCRVCYEQCPLSDEAITLDAEGRPVIQTAACVGCGVCIYVCVTSPPSISMQVRQ